MTRGRGRQAPGSPPVLRAKAPQTPAHAETTGHSDYGDQKHRRLGRRDSALPVVRSSTPGGVIVYHVNLTGRLHGRREKHRDLLVTSHGSRQAGGIGWETCSSTGAGAKSDTS